jgi:UDP:flavonoid glycosyltransferase YjiC (YdhE family)
MTTRGSAGHVLPLAPFGHACLRAGHDVLVAAQRQHEGNVVRAGLAFAPVAEPPDDQWMPLLADFAQLGIDESNARMLGEYFAQHDTRAALPGLRAIVERWQPDIIVRESWEYASTLVAEMHGVPLARVGLGLAGVEELGVRTAAPGLSQVRVEAGLPADPSGDRLREAPCLTVVPEPLDDVAEAPSARIHRFAHAVPAGATALEPLPDWWSGSDDPLVYLTFGSVAAARHLPYFPALYRAAIDVLARLPVRLLVTIGADRDPSVLGKLPPNVHVEHWVAQDAIARHAAAIVCHGGYGSTLGALGHAVPLVVLPLFSIDQWANAAAVARAGAGIALDADRSTRRVLELPPASTLDALGRAVERVLGEVSYRRAAERIAAAMRGLPPIDAAVDVLAAIARQPAAEKRAA